MSKFKMMIVGIGLVGLLGACGDSTAGVDDEITVADVERELDKILEEIHDFSDYPTGVQNGNVSKQYYESIVYYFDISDEFNQKVKEIEDGKNNYTIDERLDKHVKLVNEQIALLNGIKHNPTNDIEKEIDKYFSETLYYDEELSNYKAKYYTTKDKTYYDLADSTRVSFEQSGKVLNELLKKYELLSE